MDKDLEMQQSGKCGKPWASPSREWLVGEEKPVEAWLERRVLEGEEWLIGTKYGLGPTSWRALNVELRSVELFSWRGGAVEDF